jgi:hypothetical protein
VTRSRFDTVGADGYSLDIPRLFRHVGLAAARLPHTCEADETRERDATELRCAGESSVYLPGDGVVTVEQELVGIADRCSMGADLFDGARWTKDDE